MSFAKYSAGDFVSKRAFKFEGFKFNISTIKDSNGIKPHFVLTLEINLAKYTVRFTKSSQLRPKIKFLINQSKLTKW